MLDCHTSVLLLLSLHCIVFARLSFFNALYKEFLQTRHYIKLVLKLTFNKNLLL